MFSGIVAETGTVLALNEGDGRARLSIRSRTLVQGLAVGDSVAVDGTCLTVAAVGADTFDVDLGSETLRRTTLAACGPGAVVHLEPALRLGDRLGGHLLTGHVDGLGRVAARRQEAQGTLRLTIDAPPELAPYLVPRGSIAVDGVSLTVVDPAADRFSVLLIPHTLAVTTLGSRKPGDAVNLEADVLAKYLDHLLRRGRIEGELSWAEMAQATAGETPGRREEEDERDGTG